MGLLPLLMMAGIMAGAGLRGVNANTMAIHENQLPGVADTNVWQAGTYAARAARGTSGVPDGGKWTTANGFLAAMPRLIAR